MEPQQPVKDVTDRAAPRQRLVAGMYALVYTVMGWNGWGQLHGKPGTSQTFGWFLFLMAVAWAPAFLYTLVTGRLTQATRNLLTWSFYNQSFSRSWARGIGEREEVRNRTRLL